MVRERPTTTYSEFYNTSQPHDAVRRKYDRRKFNKQQQDNKAIKTKNGKRKPSTPLRGRRKVKKSKPLKKKK